MLKSNLIKDVKITAAILIAVIVIIIPVATGGGFKF